MIRIDDRGFVWFGSIPLQFKYIAETDMVEFHIKDRRKIHEIGDRYIEIPAKCLSDIPGAWKAKVRGVK